MSLRRSQLPEGQRLELLVMCRAAPDDLAGFFRAMIFDNARPPCLLRLASPSLVA